MPRRLLTKLGTDAGLGAARGAAACGWAVCANGTHGEAKDDAIRLCLALAAAARQQTQRRKPMAVQWSRGRAPGLLTGPTCMPACPPHTPQKPRFLYFPAAPPQNIVKKMAQSWHMTPPRQYPCPPPVGNACVRISVRLETFNGPPVMNNQGKGFSDTDACLACSPSKPIEQTKSRLCNQSSKWKNSSWHRTQYLASAHAFRSTGSPRTSP